jgi:hypothetical protein
MKTFFMIQSLHGGYYDSINETYKFRGYLYGRKYPTYEMAEQYVSEAAKIEPCKIIKVYENND